MKRLLIWLVAALLVLGLQGAGLAAAPEREEQFVYGISPWTGQTYGSTFVPKAVDTVYLLADAAHVVNGLQTDVYFWDITQEWMANWMEKREEVAGELQLLSKDGKVLNTLQRVPYAFSFTPGTFTPSALLVGDEAEAAYEAYQQSVDAYYEAMREYQEAYREYQRTLAEMVEKVNETGEAYDESEIPQPPEEPKAPQGFVTKPVDGYIIDLPAGEYRIRMVNEDGVIPDSVKNLIIFEPRRSGVGYEILPESKWTMPVNSQDTTEILYLHGSRTMYLKPFNEYEYDAKCWSRMLEAQKPMAGAGLSGVWQWQKGSELADVKVQIMRDGKVFETVEAAPYYVQQTPGYALGYEIVQFDPEKPEMEGRQPTFEAFKLELSPGSYTLRVIDAEGRVIPGSIRQIRTVADVNRWLLYGLSLVPAVLGLGIVTYRRMGSRSKAAPNA